VTGGSSGIGLATAKLFAQRGATVYITGRRQKELDEAVREIGPSATAIQGDVSRPGDIDKVYRTIREQKGKLDILFANAGIGEFAPLGQITEKHFDKQFDVNVKGTLSNRTTTSGPSFRPFRWAEQELPMRSLKRSRFSPPTKAVTLPAVNSSWTAVKARSNKDRPLWADWRARQPSPWTVQGYRLGGPLIDRTPRAQSAQPDAARGGPT